MSASQDRSPNVSPVLGPSSLRIKERRKATGKGPTSGGVRKSRRPQQTVNAHAVEAMATMAEHFTTLRNLRLAARTSNAARLELRNFFLLPILQEIEGLNGIPPSPEDTLPVFDEDEEEEGPATIAPIALLIPSNGNLVALEDEQDQEEEEEDGPAAEIRLDGDVEELFLDEPVPEQNHNQTTEERDEAESGLLEALSRINLNRAEQEEDQAPTSSAGAILPEDADEAEDFVQASQEEEQGAEVERGLLEEERAREEARLAEEQRAEAEQQAQLLAQQEQASKIAQFRARVHAVTSKAEFIVAGRKRAREDISSECRQVRQKTLLEVQQREKRKRLAERKQLARQQCLAKQRQSERQTRLVKQEEQLIAEQRAQFAEQQLANSTLQQLVAEQGVVALQQQVVLPHLVNFSAPQPVSRALSFFSQHFHSQVQPLALNYHSQAHHQQEFERQYLADQRAIAYSLQFLAPKRAVQKHLLLEQITPVHNSIMRSQGVRVGERESPKQEMKPLGFIHQGMKSSVRRTSTFLLEKVFGTFLFAFVFGGLLVGLIYWIGSNNSVEMLHFLFTTILVRLVMYLQWAMTLTILYRTYQLVKPDGFDAAEILCTMCKHVCEWIQLEAVQRAYDQVIAVGDEARRNSRRRFLTACTTVEHKVGVWVKRVKGPWRTDKKSNVGVPGENEHEEFFDCNEFWDLEPLDPYIEGLFRNTWLDNSALVNGGPKMKQLYPFVGILDNSKGMHALPSIPPMNVNQKAESKKKPQIKCVTTREVPKGSQKRIGINKESTKHSKVVIKRAVTVDRGVQTFQTRPKTKRIQKKTKTYADAATPAARELFTFHFSTIDICPIEPTPEQLTFAYTIIIDIVPETTINDEPITELGNFEGETATVTATATTKATENTKTEDRECWDPTPGEFEDEKNTVNIIEENERILGELGEKLLENLGKENRDNSMDDVMGQKEETQDVEMVYEEERLIDSDQDDVCLEEWEARDEELGDADVCSEEWEARDEELRDAEPAGDGDAFDENEVLKDAESRAGEETSLSRDSEGEEGTQAAAEVMNSRMIKQPRRRFNAAGSGGFEAPVAPQKNLQQLIEAAQLLNFSQGGNNLISTTDWNSIQLPEFTRLSEENDTLETRDEEPIPPSSPNSMELSASTKVTGLVNDTSDNEGLPLGLSSICETDQTTERLGDSLCDQEQAHEAQPTQKPAKIDLSKVEFNFAGFGMPTLSFPFVEGSSKEGKDENGLDSVDIEVLELAGVPIAKITEVEIEQLDKQSDTTSGSAGSSDWNRVENVSSQTANDKQDKLPISVIIQTAATMGEIPEKQQMTLFEKTAIVMLAEPTYGNVDKAANRSMAWKAWWQKQDTERFSRDHGLVPAPSVLEWNDAHTLDYLKKNGYIWINRLDEKFKIRPHDPAFTPEIFWEPLIAMHLKRKARV